MSGGQVSGLTRARPARFAVSWLKRNIIRNMLRFGFATLTRGKRNNGHPPKGGCAPRVAAASGWPPPLAEAPRETGSATRRKPATPPSRSSQKGPSPAVAPGRDMSTTTGRPSAWRVGPFVAWALALVASSTLDLAADVEPEPGPLLIDPTPPTTSGPVALPWVQYAWVLRLNDRNRASLADAGGRDRAMRLCAAWLAARWGPAHGVVISRRSLKYLLTGAGSLAVQFRGVALVGRLELGPLVDAELNAPVPTASSTPTANPPALVRPSAADVAELSRRRH